MNQDEGTMQELNRTNSIIKTIFKDTDNPLPSVRLKKPKYSQVNDKQLKYIIPNKKRIKFKDRLEDIVLIESFKAFNKKMCFDDYKDTVATSKKSCCDESKCILF
jgi:hypothetical protein